MKFTLSKPVSINHLYGYNKWGGVYLKKPAQIWIQESLWTIKRAEVFDVITTPVKVSIELFIGSTSDIDNYNKLLLDLISKHAQLIENDKQIMELNLVKIVTTKRAEQKIIINIEKL